MVSATGTYSVTVTAQTGCTSSTSIVITTYDCCPLTSGGTIGSNEAHCGCYVPSAITELTPPSGGTGNIEYVWLWNEDNVPNYGNGVWQVIPGATNASYQPGQICATTYYLRCSRRHGCTTYNGESNNVGKIVYNGPSASVVGTDAFICQGTTCNGSANLTVTAGTAPFTYMWNNGATTEDLTNICSGSYNVTVTDAHGCTAVASVTINCTPPPPCDIQVTISSSLGSTFCSAGGTISTTLTASSSGS